MTGLMHTKAQIEELVTHLRKEKVIAFDTEFIRENTFYPQVEIIQVATRENTWLVDARAFWKDHDGIRPLLDVFEDQSILKIIHAAQGDQECIYTCFGVVASPSLDTAVAASLCGYGDGVGLGSLLKSVLDVTIKKGHARTNWGVRPLPEQLLEYAHEDVRFLVELGQTLLEKLEVLGRQKWALELTAKFEDKSLYESDPNALAIKLSRGGKLDQKGFSVLLELCKWRETRVRELNLPRRWVADDQVLVDLAMVKPKDIGHLGSFRGLSKGELKNNGEPILAAIQRGVAQATQVEAPERRRAEIPSQAEEQAMDLLHCFIGILADEHKIAVKHLMITAQLLPLLRCEQSEWPEIWIKKGILSQGAADLVGQEIVAFLKGEITLQITSHHGRFRVSKTQHQK